MTRAVHVHEHVNVNLHDNVDVNVDVLVNVIGFRPFGCGFAAPGVSVFDSELGLNEYLA